MGDSSAKDRKSGCGVVAARFLKKLTGQDLGNEGAA
jgi:ribosomal protein L35AE/L33A